ncbi:sporulation protein [Pullulanibacillus camelliae]|uniref:Sporulation protein n=1 Tax=Pullulanibacillus camelliae TaxID=1707096 RepID=A0A8J3DU68_9BACL|nr:Spo0B C-terminal domain-containing protein [Pullulanibacillus camelliae]GGE42740.1 sporulation protein [Pullulanibacillus camelliae]
MHDPDKMIDLLRAIRHDWLNELQLIKANLDLNRVERVSEIVDLLVSKAKNEAQLSNLCAPKTAAYLLTYNLNRPMVTLDVEVVGKVLDLSHADECLYTYFLNVLTYFNTKAEQQANNNVTISIDLEEHQATFTIDFAGSLTDVLESERFFMKQASYHSLDYVTKYIHKEEAILAFIITT